MSKVKKITPCLWFDREAEEAAKFYTGIFKNSRILETSYYCDTGQEVHGMPAGTVLTVLFELEGQSFTALNGGPIFKFNEAVSFQVDCDDQAEVDYFWEKLSEGGDPQARQCGWVKDKFGVSWQVVPSILAELLTDPDKEKATRAMAAMMEMKKLDIAGLKKAHAGEG